MNDAEKEIERVSMMLAEIFNEITGRRFRVSNKLRRSVEFLVQWDHSDDEICLFYRAKVNRILANQQEFEKRYPEFGPDRSLTPASMVPAGCEIAKSLDDCLADWIGLPSGALDGIEGRRD